MKLSPRVEFYLKHQQQIDEWANLQKIAFAEADKFFESVFDDLDEVCASFPGQPRFEKFLDGSWPSAHLWKASWEDAEEGKIENWLGVSVSFQWHRSRSLFDGLFGGVNNLRDQPGSATLRAAVDAGLPEGRDRYRENKWWACHRHIEPTSPAYYEDLDSWKAEILREIETVWRHFHPVVDRVVAELCAKR